MEAMKGQMVKLATKEKRFNKDQIEQAEKIMMNASYGSKAMGILNKYWQSKMSPQKQTSPTITTDHDP